MSEEGKGWGGVREGAGRPHEHLWYIIVEVVDALGEEEDIIAGLSIKRDGTPNLRTEQRAREIAAHHVEQDAQSVSIVKKQCCTVTEAEVIEKVK